MKEQIADSLSRLAHWVERNDYKAYDPGDGQLSFLRTLTFEHPLLKRLLTGVVLRSPFNIRPLIGINPHTSTKGMGYMAWGYLKLFQLTGQNSYASKAMKCLDWLIENRSKKSQHHCWGNSFDFSTRAGTIPCQEPTIVWSGLIGQAFMEAYEVLDEKRYLDVAASVCEWILTIPQERTDQGACLSYVGYNQVSIHNSNMLGAALLGRVGRITSNKQALHTAKQAMLYSCTRQNPDGAWYYGEASKYHWIDSFHTGYNLDCLKRYIDSTGDHSFDNQLNAGFRYFKANFFESNGTPKYFHDRVQPIDIQCAAQAIDTLAFFSKGDAEALGLAIKVAAWTMHNMQDEDGHFYYRDLGWKKVKTPMLHWGQGTMFKALANLACKLKDETTNVKPTLGEVFANRGLNPQLTPELAVR